MWRLLGVLAVLTGAAVAGWLLDGGLGRALRGAPPHISPTDVNRLVGAILGPAGTAWDWMPLPGLYLLGGLLALSIVQCITLLTVRLWMRHRRHYVRLRVIAHRTDQASAESLLRLYEALHKRLLRRWWRRTLLGQPTVALEVRFEHPREEVKGAASRAWLAVCCPLGLERMVEAALRTAYPNCRLAPVLDEATAPRTIVRLKKDAEFIRRAKSLDRFEPEREPAMNRLLTVMAACAEPVLLQLSLTPAPVVFERFARRRFKAHELRLARERQALSAGRDRSMVEDAELRGGLRVQHQPLFFTDIRIVAEDRVTCERVASELRVGDAENRLIERGTFVRHGLLGLYRRRVKRGEGNPLPGFHRGVFAAGELASLWHLPSIDYLTVPFAREAVPLAPAPPGIMRPGEGDGTLCDAIGPVSIHVDLRKQNTAVPGAVEQGKSSYLVATVAEDLRREPCAVIVLDPKGDAADAAVSLVAPDRTCTLLDFARPTCGFNPLAVDAPADVIADYVVTALKNLFTDADIRASSDRYLRNAIIAVLAYDRSSTLWDAARLLSVGEDGYAYRRSVGARVRALPEFSEISTFFTSELAAQLADARSTTTAKLDAPVNKLARLLNSTSIKRVLLNESLTVNFDHVIAGREVLVVKGALGVMGAGNTSVLMQLLIGMLDAALARQQDLITPDRRVAVALKVDEAPLVLTRGFAETMALKRSAGLETVACWQTDAQWTDRELRDQLDALFTHRVYFATASTRDARDAVGLTSAEFTDTVRPGMAHLSKLAHPDARLHLPKHYAIASWATSEGRQSPFIARTIPMRIDSARLELHAARQQERGGRYKADLRQVHWRERSEDPAGRRDGAGEGRREQGASSVLARPPARGVGAALHAHHAHRSSDDSQSVASGRTRTESPLSDVPCDAYRELVELDLAHSMRWAKPLQSPVALQPDAQDLEMLELIAALGHVLSSQLHRRFNAARAVTTTQRRLKRLSDAGLVERFQFHRRDGGGVPMCYLITRAGMEMLRLCDRSPALDPPVARQEASAEGAPSDDRASRRRSPALLRQARHGVHVAAWALSLAAIEGDPRTSILGAAQSVLTPPRLPRRGSGSAAADFDAALRLSDLHLPAGRVPHDFLRTDGDGESVEVERFETIRPDAIVKLASTRLDVMVELDDRLPVGRGVGKLQRYDHFLTGWSTCLRRYGERKEAEPLLVFVCRDRARARRCAQLADATLIACRAYPGEYPQDWDYPARRRTLFVAERDALEGLVRAYGVPPLPPAVRVASSGGDPSAGAAGVQQRQLLATEDLAR
jgi:Replication-relaxation